MERRFRVRLDELLDDAEVPPGLLHGVLPRLASFLQPFFAAVLVVVKLAQQNFPNTGLYIVAALAGLSDVDAITLSMAQQAKSGDADMAIAAIVIAVVSNTLVKAGMAASLGSANLRRPVLLAAFAVVASGAAVAWLLR